MDDNKQDSKNDEWFNGYREGFEEADDRHSMQLALITIIAWTLGILAGMFMP